MSDAGAPGDGPGTGTPAPFGRRLAAAMAAHGPLCVGIDPHPALLHRWGLGDDAGGLRTFGLRVLDALAGQVAALKPQSAFYERHGSAGIAVLEELLAAAGESGVLTVLDVKRGDVGSTMLGYADAYLRPSSPLAADAVTLSPYLGLGSLATAIETALDSGRGVFVLALTSNPEGAGVQHARDASGRAVAGQVLDGVGALNAAELGAGEPLGSIGLVVGATVGAAARELGIDLAAAGGALLAPGIGAQGAGAREVAEVFAGAERAVLASTSRAVLSAGPDAADLRAAARAATDGVRAALGA